MTFTTVTAMGDEQTFTTLEAAKAHAQKCADSSGKHVDVVDDSSDATVFVAVPA